MSFVRKQRVNDIVVDNVYEKITSEGDAANFSAEAPGKRAVFKFNSLPVGDFNKYVTIELPFAFLLNQNQLEVYWEMTDRLVSPVAYQGFARLITRELAEQLDTFDPNADVYYEEVDSSQIRVYNIGSLSPRPFFNNDPSQIGPGSSNAFLCSVPHTSIPATRENRVVVENQGDNTAVELLGAGDGIVFTSVSGRRFLVRPDDGGTITTTEI